MGQLDSNVQSPTAAGAGRRRSVAVKKLFEKKTFFCHVRTSFSFDGCNG
jgi:hypothetical protein